MRTISYTVRDAADLAAATTASTKWVPAFGARCVVFEWKATNANPLQNAGNQTESTNADPTVAGGSTWSGAPMNLATPAPTVATIALNGAQGGLRCVVVSANSQPFITQKAIRMNVLGHATLIVTGLSCIAHVIYDGDAEHVPTGQAAV